MATAVRPDIVVHKPNGPLAAVIEVKNREEMNPQIAAVLRRNLIAHHVLADVPYFLLLSQDKGYLWTNRRPKELSIEPDAELSMKEVFESYLPPEIEGRLRDTELVIAVYSWLSDLALTKRDPIGRTEKVLAPGWLGQIWSPLVGLRGAE